MLAFQGLGHKNKVVGIGDGFKLRATCAVVLEWGTNVGPVAHNSAAVFVRCVRGSGRVSAAAVVEYDWTV